MAKQRAKLAANAIMSLDAHISNDRELTTSNHPSESAGTIYLSDVATRFASKRRGSQPNIIRMVNDTVILVVCRAGGNAIQVAP